MSIHIGAHQGQIAPTILLPGDPMRAKHIAETMLTEVTCFNQVRGMLGYTGHYAGRLISVMGTGMGMPSISIYVHEMINEYRVRTLIRVGTCGALRSELKIGDIVLPISCSTNSNINRIHFDGMDYAPAASFRLLRLACEAAERRSLQVFAGVGFSSDTFYEDDPEWWKKWAAHGVLACDMETSALYTLAAKFGVEALSILTVSDSLVSGEAATAKQRETGFPRMVELAMDIVP